MTLFSRLAGDRLPALTRGTFARATRRVTQLSVSVFALWAALGCDATEAVKNFGAPTSKAAPLAAPLPRVGIGIDSVKYYDTQWMFRDVAGIWNEAEGHWQIVGEGPAPTFDAQGFPQSLAEGQMAEVHPFRNNGQRFPAGDWVLEWEGQGEILVRRAQEISVTPGRKVYRIDEPDERGLTIRIAATDPSDPVRNVRLLMPGTTEQESAFHPLFVQRLRPFGVLRFMDSFETNNSKELAWADRTQPNAFFRARKGYGIAYEVGIDLCNELGADFWLNVPHAATDDYLRELARLVRDRLAPGQRVWVEYSNETWNRGFKKQFQHTEALQKKWGLDSRPAAHARRSVEIFDLFEKEFEGRDRLVRVLSGQAGSPWQLKAALAEVDALSGEGPLKTDVISIAYYFVGADEDTIILARTGGASDRLFEHLNQKVERLAEADSIWANHINLAEEYGLPLVGYEGGQHLNASAAQSSLGLSREETEALAEIFAEVSRDPRMGQLYARALSIWDELGGATPVAFQYVRKWNRYGQWGHLEYQDQPVDEAPNYRALLDFAGVEAEAY